jgi:hypothetical protein
MSFTVLTSSSRTANIVSCGHWRAACSMESVVQSQRGHFWNLFHSEGGSRVFGSMSLRGFSNSLRSSSRLSLLGSGSESSLQVFERKQDVDKGLL